MWLPSSYRINALNKFFGFIFLTFLINTSLFSAHSFDENVYFLNRISFGPNAEDLKQIEKLGLRNYLSEQLNYETIPLPKTFLDKINQYSILNQTTKELAEKDEDNFINGQKIWLESSELRLIHSIESPRQLYEVMVEFWFNHFNVSAKKGIVKRLAWNYENEAIRPYALGKFSDLLMTTAKHPAMLFYLDNWQNKVAHNDWVPRRNKRGQIIPRKIPKKTEKTGINENYAREVMELHTLGVDGGYKQADVIALANILSGWTFFRQDRKGVSAYSFFFDETSHNSAPQNLLGKTFSEKGINQGINALNYLSLHPSTAHHICLKLAERFVSDKPDPNFVKLLADVFIRSQGDIKTTLMALFDSHYFLNETNFNNKFKTPYHYIVSTIRLSAVNISNFRPLINQLNEQDMPIYGYETPDGYKYDKASWLTPNAIINRIAFATAFSLGRLPLYVKQKEDNFEKKPILFSNLKETAKRLFSNEILLDIEKAPKSDQTALILANPEMMKF